MFGDPYGDKAAALVDQAARAEALEKRQPALPRYIPFTHARSWYLLAVTSPATLTTVPDADADAVILDIEDGVDDLRKPIARRTVAAWLNECGRAWVRINPRGTEFWDADCGELEGADGLIGVVLAKAESADDVAATAARLPGVPLIPLIESALGIERAFEIARAPGVVRLAFGSGDFRRDTGMAATEEAMRYPRAQLTMASRAAGLPGPVDGPATAGDDEGRRAQTAAAGELGMSGKLCLDVEHAAIIDECLTPTADEVAWANGQLEAFEAAGRVIRDGSDRPRLAQAERIRELAQVYHLDSPRRGDPQHPTKEPA